LAGPRTVLRAAKGVVKFVESDDHPDEREPMLTRRSPFEPARKLCPRCLTPLKANMGIGGFITPMNYSCPKCGYYGTVFFEGEGEPQKGTD
jgi:hypothetical protein